MKIIQQTTGIEPSEEKCRKSGKRERKKQREKEKKWVGPSYLF